MIENWMANQTSEEGNLLTGSLASVCNKILVPEIYTWTYMNMTQDRCEFWIPYLRQEKSMRSFFSDWLYYTPIPGQPGLSRDRYERPINGPGYYIELYDFIANTIPGRELNFMNKNFAAWMVRFLNIRGKWLETADSVAPYKEDNYQVVTPSDIWIDYNIRSGQHPYTIEEYIVPEGGFRKY